MMAQRRPQGDHLCQTASKFEADLSRSVTLESAVDVVQNLTDRLGCTGFTFVTLKACRDGGTLVDSVSTYPKDWRHHYRRNDLVVRDPVLGTCAHKITPMRWNDLEATRRSQNLETETFDAAHRFGLRDGLAVPVHHAADGYSVFNVATDLSPMDANSLFDRFQHTLHAIALMLYDFLNRCAAKHIFDLPQSRLNRYDIGDIVGYAGDLS